MPRYFTLEEANRLLPRLRELMARLQERNVELERRQEGLLSLARLAAGDGLAQEREADQARRAVEEATDEINALVEEVQALGCEVKDPERGLVDFRAWHEGREVYLCWRLGEERIAYWHDLQAGFAGRQPL